MPSAVVLGAGWAGLAAAFDLRRAGLDTTLLEKTSGPGGLGRSFKDPQGSDELDNGQHLMLDSYTETFRLLGECGVEPPVRRLPTMSMILRGPGGEEIRLACPPLPSFLSLPLGILGLRGISLIEKALCLAGPVLGGLPLSQDCSVETLLDRWRQPKSLRRLFWRPLCLGTLNTESREASAHIFLQVLWQGFLRHPLKSRFALPTRGLSAVYPEPVRAALEKLGVHLLFQDPATSLEISGTRVSRVHSRSGNSSPDLVISALPWDAAAALAPQIRGASLEPSPIVTAYLWYDSSPTEEPMTGLLDLPFDWIFDRGLLFGTGSGPLALVKSAAQDLAGKDSAGIIPMAADTVSQAFPKFGGKFLRASVFKELKATFKARPGINRLRPGPQGPFSNLFLAGAWTDTGLPATLEGAVRSGRRAARAAIESLL